MNHRIAELPSAFLVNSHPNSRATGNKGTEKIPVSAMMAYNPAKFPGFTTQTPHISNGNEGRERIGGGLTSPNKGKPTRSYNGNEYLDGDGEVIREDAVEERGCDDGGEDTREKECGAHEA